MVCLGVKPGPAGWKAQTNPLSYGGTPIVELFLPFILSPQWPQVAKQYQSSLLIKFPGNNLALVSICQMALHRT